MAVRVVRGQLNDLAYGVIQQVDIGWVMDIRFDDKGVATGR